MRDVLLAGGSFEVRKLREAGRGRPFAGAARSSTAPASAPATSLATRIADPGPRPARHPATAARDPLRLPMEFRATCSPAPTASFSAARSSGTCGARARSQADRRHHRRPGKRFFSAFRCTVLKPPRAPDIVRGRVYRDLDPPERRGAGRNAEDKLTPKAIVAALNEHIIGQDDAEKAVAVRLAQPLAPPTAFARTARPR